MINSLQIFTTNVSESLYHGVCINDLMEKMKFLISVNVMLSLIHRTEYVTCSIVCFRNEHSAGGK